MLFGTDCGAMLPETPLWEPANVPRSGPLISTSVRRPPYGETKFEPLIVVVRSRRTVGPLAPCAWPIVTGALHDEPKVAFVGAIVSALMASPAKTVAERKPAEPV